MSSELVLLSSSISLRVSAPVTTPIPPPVVLQGLIMKGLPNFATIDVSFISLSLILPVLKTILLPGGNVMALVKPQFEAGKENVGKKGIVRDPKIHLEVVENIAEMATNIGFVVKDASYSPITGGEGNIEFLFHLINPADNEIIEPFTDFKSIVQLAHQQFK